MTIGDWLDQAANRLEGAGIESSRLEAAVLLAAALGVDRSWVLAHVGDSFIRQVEADRLLARRIAREPLAYIVGRREFFGREFRVGPGVLIPRQETEILVEAALAIAESGWVVADIGTGSGCVAISIALERPALRVIGVDVSSEALAYARTNAESLGADIELVHADGPDWLASHAADLVVSNPPYVGTRDPLPPEVALYEPASALFAGFEGLEFFRRLAAIGCPRIRLLTEIGDGQAPAVTAVFEKAGWQSEGLWRDLDGRIRVLGFSLP